MSQLKKYKLDQLCNVVSYENTESEKMGKQIIENLKTIGLELN